MLIIYYNDKAASLMPKRIYSHRTLYLDRTFTKQEIVVITMAAINWSESTNHIMIYDIVILPINRKIDLMRGLVFSKVSPDHPDVMMQNNFEEENTLAYYYHNNIIDYIIIVGNLEDIESYRAIVLHELGHSLGLKHNIGLNGLGTLMFPSKDFGANRITQTDLENFCKIYSCDASQLKNQEETFHLRTPNIFGKFFNFLYVTGI